MPARNLAVAILLAWAPAAAWGQSASLRGVVADRRSHAPLAQARVRLVNAADTSDVREAVTGADGAFLVPGLATTAYRVTASRLGYAPLRRAVGIARATQTLDTLFLAVAAVELPGTTIEAAPPAVAQHADTTEFAARAYKVRRDADAGELLSKMPGITVDNAGTIKSNGEQVQQILLDGRPYFGSDPTIAIRNLPAEVIDRIQVFDKLSDQSQFTGFDDGQAQKTINIVLRADRRDRPFGKAYAGAGDDGRYLTGGNANAVADSMHYALIALGDNVNQQNFSSQDLLGVLNAGGQRGGAFGGGFGRRGGGGGQRRGAGGGFGGTFGGGGFGGGFGSNGGANPGQFLVGQQDGITDTRSVGGNQSGALGPLGFSQSYFDNATANHNDQALARQYAVPQDSIARYDQTSADREHDQNHRYDARAEWRLSPATSLIATPRLYFQSHQSNDALAGVNADASGAPLGTGTSDTQGSTSGHDVSNHVLLRHRFAPRGRTFSFDLGLGHTLKDGGSTLHGLAVFGADSAATRDTTDQHTTLHATNATLSARAVATTALGASGLATLTWAPSYAHGASDQRAARFDPATQGYTLADTGLSNRFTTRQLTNLAQLGVLMRRRTLNLAANLGWQWTRLDDAQQFPFADDTRRTFGALVPSLFANITFADRRNLRVSGFTAVRPPSVAQLQQAVDNSNPLQLSTGNPALQPAVAHTLVARFSAADPARGRGTFVLLSVQQTTHAIANATFTATRDSVLTGGVVLPAGAQLVRPVNLNGAWTVNTFTTVSRPVRRLASTLNLNAGLTWTRTPGLFDGLANTSSAWTGSGGIVLASNISENVDFTLGYTATLGVARNSVEHGLDTRDRTHTLTARVSLVGWRGIALRNELSATIEHGLATGYDRNLTLWNASLGKKLLKDERGELSVQATDLLHQNRSTTRTVADTYVQDTRNEILPAYVMVSFTYALR